jgi:uncharacterized protein YegL
MVGSKIDALNQVVSGFVGDLRQEPYALETVLLAYLGFSHQPKLIQPLEELPSILSHTFKAVPSSPPMLGAGIECQRTIMLATLRSTPLKRKNGWPSLVFIVFGVAPSDREAAQQELESLMAELDVIVVFVVMNEKHISLYQSLLPKARLIVGSYRFMLDSNVVGFRKIDANPLYNAYRNFLGYWIEREVSSEEPSYDVPIPPLPPEVVIYL